MEEHKDVFDKILNNISDKVDYADIRAGKGNSNSIIMKDGEIQEINSGLNIGARIRVLKNGAWGFGFTSEISKLEEMAESALKLSKSLKGDVELDTIDIVNDNVKTPREISVSDVSVEEKKEIINEAYKSANIGEVVSTTVSYSDTESTNVFVNSEGSSIVMDETRVGLFLNAVASSGEVIQFSHGSLGGASGFEVLKKADIEKFGRKIGEKASRLLKAKTPPSGKFTIITDNELTGVFIHEALGHAVEADLILQNDSILKDQIGNQIGSNNVNIIDDPSRTDGFGYYAYDAEGVKTAPNQLVKDGKLISLLNSRETAKKLGMHSTGNSRSVISDQPIVRMSNTYLKPQDLSFDELIEDIKDGIYLKGSRGGQVDTGKGIFQFNASESFKIVNGELQDPLRDVSLSGNILETLKHVDGIGNDFKLSVGFCGKSGQSAPVGDGGPHTRITDTMVGGSS
ncbi:TldD/PmbA family protein [Methanobrevibacter filiformis]|uniref:Metalloprotease TldD n=1 Tax=Methanobrevibacter filiformis TaxID=55758 RepID=A0A166F5E7_9EURY|nr:TldD/PmbA family protein [Methanobrevibacter filiformis]KZX17333.1 metalloprotease TldD [Methanobrevibacter filiformis]